MSTFNSKLNALRLRYEALLTKPNHVEENGNGGATIWMNVLIHS